MSARLSQAQVRTFTLDEPRMLREYALPRCRLLMALALNCGFGVGERRAGAVPAAGAGDAGLAGRVLSRVVLFRLNRKHLDVRFADGSRWEARFGGG